MLPVVYRIWACARMVQLEEWFKSRVPGFLALEVVVGRLRLGMLRLLILRRFLLALPGSHVHLFVADVIKSFDMGFLSCLGLPAGFRHAHFEYHAHVLLRFKLAAGLDAPWTRDEGIPQGCPLSMMFIVALYLPWCRYLAAQVGVQPQLYSDNLKCLSGDPGLL